LLIARFFYTSDESISAGESVNYLESELLSYTV